MVKINSLIHIPVNIPAVTAGAVRAICFDLDNTLWDLGPVLSRADRILNDWLEARYPRIPERFPPAAVQEVRDALLLEQPHRSHDLTYLRRETFARMAEAVGYERDAEQWQRRPGRDRHRAPL